MGSHPLCRAEDNKVLAERFSTLEALRSHPDVVRFAAWNAKQRAPAHGAAQLRLPR